MMTTVLMLLHFACAGWPNFAPQCMMFCVEGIIIKVVRADYFCDAIDNLQKCWAKDRTKGKGTLKVK